MNKLEVQKRVTGNGEPLPLESFEWDENRRVFSSRSRELVLYFQGIDDITFNTSNFCDFVTGSGCNFNTGSHCNFTTWCHGCNFKTGSDCNFNTGGDCSFITENRCTFVVCKLCGFKVGAECTIISWDHSTNKKITLQPDAGDTIQFFDLVVDNAHTEHAYIKNGVYNGSLTS
jgi:hypothetical protein